jgi:hypothetical protein
MGTEKKYDETKQRKLLIVHSFLYCAAATKRVASHRPVFAFFSSRYTLTNAFKPC